MVELENYIKTKSNQKRNQKQIIKNVRDDQLKKYEEAQIKLEREQQAFREAAARRQAAILAE